ncbi:P-loop containing nucleoside triphosphate hydrolase protein [Atractiella rhizophila]|nr:P-loop containing nucleoside triphosphate hydrolase protein [Atractiella rhizophila]
MVAGPFALADLPASWFGAFYDNHKEWFKPLLQQFGVDEDGKEDAFGPVSGERTTDFTEMFEGFVLLLLPPIVLLLGTLTILPSLSGATDWELRRKWLSREKESMEGKVNYGGFMQSSSPSKAAEFVPSRLRNVPMLFLKLALSAIAFASLITSASLAHKAEAKAATIVGYTIAAVGTLGAAILSAIVHRRTYRPSPLLQSFGILQTLALAIRTRTAFTEKEGPLAIVGAIGLGATVLLTFLEGVARVSKRTASRCGIPPDEVSSLLSIVSAQFVQPLFSYAYRQHRKKADVDESAIWSLRFDLQARGISEGWENGWALELARAKRKGVKPRFWTFIIKQYFPPLFAPVMLGILAQLSIYATPALLDGLLTFLAQSATPNPPPASRGWELALGFFGITVVMTALTQASYYFMLPSLLRMRAGVMQAVFRKAFVLAPEEWGKRSAGDLSNHISVDAERFCDDWAHNAPLLLGLIPQLALGVFLVYQQLSWAVFPGLAWMLIIMFGITPFQGKEMAAGFKMSLEGLDTRNTIIQESVSEIQFIKFNAWERPMMERIQAARTIELNGFKKVAMMFARAVFASQLGRNGTPIIMFAVYAATNGNFDANKIFVSLTAIALVQLNFDQLTFILNWLNRVAAYLEAQELDNVSTAASTARESASEMDDATKVEVLLEEKEKEKPGSSLTGVEPRLPWIENATVAWKKDAEESDFKLKDVSLRLREGELLGIVGRIASGKSSFVAALLGQMHFIEGSFFISDVPIAFCPQSPFLISASIQENITWGLPLDGDRVNIVIRACCLDVDLNIIPGGLKAEVGEKGLNLSGGQKARLALARACYAALSGAVQCVILDDVLSAVDAETDRKLFDNVIGPKGLLAARKLTRVLVTHAAHHFGKLDRLMLLEEGKIRGIGSHTELMNIKEYQELVAHNLASEEQAEGMEEDVQTAVEGGKKIQVTDEGKNLTEDEEMIKGRVTFRTYIQYFKAGGLSTFFGVVACFVLARGLVYGAQFWLTHFLNEADQKKHSVAFYLGIYGLIVVASVAFAPMGFYASKGIMSVKASRNIFNSILPKVFRATPMFFDTTPSGRITTRLSSDQRQIDNEFSMAILGIDLYTRLNPGTSVTIHIGCSETHHPSQATLPVLVPIFVGFTAYAQASSRSIRRLDSGRTRAPLYALATETFVGINSVTAYGAKARYIDELFSRIDRNQKAKYWELVAQEYLMFRVDSLSGLIVFLGAVFVIALKSTLSPGVAGIAISSLVTLSQILASAAHVFNQLETGAVHLERALEYRNLPSEAAEHTPADEKLPAQWPVAGTFEFKGYSTRYRPNLPFCLKNLTLKFEGGKRIAIVGRSGSGKSSMTLALFRLLEAAEGQIFLDGVDISTLGLTRVRSSLGIIPQTPSLFGGTLRSNLCPLKQYEDAELWRALEFVGLKDYVSALPGKLDEPMQVAGRNFSAGQLQQITLARALLSKVKVLVLDEATSNMDTVTDALIQKAIREGFAGQTVITVAHRIKTIIDYDHVLVLSAGEVAEFGCPQDLLKDPTSKFWALAHEAGEV